VRTRSVPFKATFNWVEMQKYSGMLLESFQNGQYFPSWNWKCRNFGKSKLNLSNLLNESLFRLSEIFDFHTRSEGFSPLASHYSDLQKYQLTSAGFSGGSTRFLFFWGGEGIFKNVVRVACIFALSNRLHNPCILWLLWEKLSFWSYLVEALDVIIFYLRYEIGTGKR